MNTRVGRIGRFLLTSDDPVVVRYLLGNLLIPHGRRARLSRTLLPWLPRAARRVLTAQSKQCAYDPAAGEIPAWLWDAAEDLTRAAGLPPRGRPRWILLVDPQSTSRMRATLFLFPRGATRPDAVLKVRGTACTARALEEEWNALVRVSVHSPALGATLPAPLAYARSGQAESLLLSCLDGVSMHMKLQSGARPGRVSPCLVSVADWLARLHGPAEDGSAQRGVSVHGDFWPHNVLVSRDGSVTGVVDWEHGAEAGSRAVDLFQFPLSYALHCGRRLQAGTPAAGVFRDTLLEEGPLAASVRAYLGAYCTATGLQPSTLRQLLDIYFTTRPLPLPGAPQTGSPLPDDAALACRDALARSPRPAFLPSCAHLS